MSSLSSIVAAEGPLDLGCSGPDVRALQLALSTAGCRADITSGDFTEDTDYWVRRLQRQHCLKDDGIVDPVTAALLDAPATSLVETAKPEVKNNALLSLIAGIAAVILIAIAVAHAGPLPDKSKTPGMADHSLTARVLCSKSFRTSQVRHVTAATKRKVYAAYGMSPRRPPCPCEVDHLVSLELGGSNAIENLWPQPYKTKPWNARVKDRLENRLHRLVCAGRVSLKEAQREIATDWTGAYKRWLTRPSTSSASFRRAKAPSPCN